MFLLLILVEWIYSSKLEDIRFPATCEYLQAGPKLTKKFEQLFDTQVRALIEMERFDPLEALRRVKLVSLLKLSIQKPLTNF